MEESLIVKKLEDVDKEIHALINGLKPKKPKISPEEIRELLSSRVKHDIDTTKLIREMRDKEYNL